MYGAQADCNAGAVLKAGFRHQKSNILFLPLLPPHTTRPESSLPVWLFRHYPDTIY